MTPHQTIDRAWPWLVCFAAGLANFLTNGGVRSMGIVFVQLQQRFNTNAGITGLVFGCTAAGFAISSVIGNVLGSFYGNRPVALTGAAMTSVSLLLTAFAPSIHLVVTLGLSAGIGYGFIFAPSMVVVGQYFNKRRVQGSTLAVAGGSLGQVVIPFLFVSFVNMFNFQGGIMLYAAITLHAIPTALLLRPPKAIQKVEYMTAVTNDCPTEDSRLTLHTGDARSNGHLHTSQESLSNPTLLYSDAGFAQKNTIYEDVSFHNESWTVPSDMNTHSLIDMHDLGFYYSDTNPIMTPSAFNCQQLMQRCSDPTTEENEPYKSTTQTNFVDDVLGYKCCKIKSDLGPLPDYRHQDDQIKKIVEQRIDKLQSKQNLYEQSEDRANDLGDFLLSLRQTEYDILDEITKDCYLTQSGLQESDDNVTPEDNSEAGTQRSEYKDESSTKQAYEDTALQADSEMACFRENFNPEPKQSFSDIFKLLDTPVRRIDFDIDESFDFNFSVGSLNFDVIDHIKEEKTSSEQKINYDFITNSNNEGTDEKNGSTQQKGKHIIEHKQKSLQHKKKSTTNSKTSKHRKKPSDHKKNSSEHRIKTKKRKLKPVEKQLTSTENMDRIISFSPENNCKILNHSSDKINSDQQEMVNHSPKATNLRSSVPNFTTSDEWSGFLKSNALFSSNNFVFDDAIKTVSAKDLAILLNEDLDSKSKETLAIFKNASSSNFKQPSFNRCCKLFVNKVLDQRLLTNWSYLLFVTGLVFSQGGYMNGCFFLPVFATEMGHSDLTMAVLVSIMGVADLLAQIAGSFYSDQRTFKVTTLLGSLLVVCGLLALLMTSYPHLWVLVLYGIFHGLLCGAYMSMLVAALADAIGIENLASGIGFSTILNGMFMLPSSSLLGLVEEVTGSFALSMRISGLFLIMGGLIFHIQPFIRKFQSSRTSSSPQSKTTEAQQNSQAAGNVHLKLDNVILCKETVI